MSILKEIRESLADMASGLYNDWKEKLIVFSVAGLLVGLAIFLVGFLPKILAVEQCHADVYYEIPWYVILIATVVGLALATDFAIFIAAPIAGAIFVLLGVPLLYLLGGLYNMLPDVETPQWVNNIDNSIGNTLESKGAEVLGNIILWLLIIVASVIVIASLTWIVYSGLFCINI